MRHQALAATFLSALAVAGAAGCGSSSAPPQDSAAIEARISRERAEAAKSARQDERIKQLEAEAAKTKKAKRKSATRTVTTPAPTPAPAAPVAGPDPTSNASDDWPGGSGQTVILASVGSQAEARKIQGQATEAGLDAGVLFSSDYTSLRAGYWVAFSGKFDTTNSASQRQSRARSLGFSQAYVRFVSR